MTNNHNVNDVVAVVETIENDDDDSGVMLEARMNGTDGRYYQEQVIRNNDDEQELLLVGKVLCYDNLMAPSPKSTTSINHQQLVSFSPFLSERLPIA